MLAFCAFVAYLYSCAVLYSTCTLRDVAWLSYISKGSELSALTNSSLVVTHPSKSQAERCSLPGLSVELIHSSPAPSLPQAQKAWFIRSINNIPLVLNRGGQSYFKSNGDEALSDESLNKSNGDEALNVDWQKMAQEFSTHMYKQRQQRFSALRQQ
jgi:hypothetical protein